MRRVIMVAMVIVELALIVIGVSSAFTGVGVFASTGNSETCVAWAEGLLGGGFLSRTYKSPGLHYETEKAGEWCWWFLAEIDSERFIIAAPIWLIALFPISILAWQFHHRPRS